MQLQLHRQAKPQAGFIPGAGGQGRLAEECPGSGLQRRAVVCKWAAAEGKIKAPSLGPRLGTCPEMGSSSASSQLTPACRRERVAGGKGCLGKALCLDGVSPPGSLQRQAVVVGRVLAVSAVGGELGLEGMVQPLPAQALPFGCLGVLGQGSRGGVKPQRLRDQVVVVLGAGVDQRGRDAGGMLGDALSQAGQAGGGGMGRGGENLGSENQCA